LQPMERAKERERERQRRVCVRGIQRKKMEWEQKRAEDSKPQDLCPIGENDFVPLRQKKKR